MTKRPEIFLGPSILLPLLSSLIDDTPQVSFNSVLLECLLVSVSISINFKVAEPKNNIS